MSKEILESTKDRFGVEVRVGDTVIYTNYHKLFKGKVEKITPCGVTIEKGSNQSTDKFAKL